MMDEEREEAFYESPYQRPEPAADAPDISGEELSPLEEAKLAKKRATYLEKATKLRAKAAKLVAQAKKLRAKAEAMEGKARRYEEKAADFEARG